MVQVKCSVEIEGCDVIKNTWHAIRPYQSTNLTITPSKCVGKVTELVFKLVLARLCRHATNRCTERYGYVSLIRSCMPTGMQICL
jgi:hypothetical protein